MKKFKNLLIEKSDESMILDIQHFSCTHNVKDFIEKHNLNIQKLYEYVVKGKLKERNNFVTAISGYEDPKKNKYLKYFIDNFSN